MVEPKRNGADDLMKYSVGALPTSTPMVLRLVFHLLGTVENEEANTNVSWHSDMITLHGIVSELRQFSLCVLYVNAIY